MKNIRLILLLILGLVVLAGYERYTRKVYFSQRQTELELRCKLSQKRLEKRIETSLGGLDYLAVFVSGGGEAGQDRFSSRCKIVATRYFPFDKIHFVDATNGTTLTYDPGQQLVDIEEVVQTVGSRNAIRRAIELEQSIVQIVPSTELEGKLIVIRTPVFSKGRYQGIITAYAPLSSFLVDIAEDAQIEGLSFALRDNEGNIIYGNSAAQPPPFLGSIRFGDVVWYMEGRWDLMDQGFHTMASYIGYVFGLFFIFLIGYLTFISDRYSKDLELRLDEKEKTIQGINTKFVEEVKSNRETAQALLKSEERYRALFDNNPIQTIVVDNLCRIVMYNFARTKVAGRLPVIGALMYRDYAKHHEIDMFSELVRCIESGKQKEFPELKYRAKYLRIHISPFTEGAIITCIDITAMKRLFDELQHSHKMEALGTLAGGIAHEFNNILGIIIGNVELAIDDLAEWNPTRECMSEIHSASLRAKEVVRQLLSFSRQKEHEMKPIRLNEVVEETINNLVRASIPSSIEIYTSIQKNIPLIMADPSQIQQVLINLCSNSAQAMESERGTIQIEMQEFTLPYEREEEFMHLKPGNYLMLVVRDNGKGIAHEIKERIFDPYFTTNEYGKGVGMGLSIVHSIVKNHGGEILLQSAVDEGTVVKILFPQLIGHTPLS